MAKQDEDCKLIYLEEKKDEFGASDKLNIKSKEDSDGIFTTLSNIPLEDADEFGIRVGNGPGTNAIGVCLITDEEYVPNIRNTY